jgi:hypothetical protein
MVAWALGYVVVALLAALQLFRMRDPQRIRSSHSRMSATSSAQRLWGIG